MPSYYLKLIILIKYKMKRTLLLIPGFSESATNAPYVTFTEKFKDEFCVVTHTPNWNNGTASNRLVDLKIILNTLEIKNTTVVSFSLGAYIALIAAETYPFQKVILCSLSPFFDEQLSHMPTAAKKYLGINRVNDFSNHLIPQSITCPSIFLFGSLDWSFGIDEARKLASKYNGIFEIIPDTPHELTEEYLLKISAYVLE